ncbi:hypothetical protein E2C01_056814 [Portunus trituberculatus]|uniref:Uncharacterized protein n=1 Tax=Portunus trituberculatus TaxID=210409 RepID=A0A5B7GYF6_PORTR|nr:hypothetical protein [Portunus trituberculatus]
MVLGLAGGAWLLCGVSLGLPLERTYAPDPRPYTAAVFSNKDVEESSGSWVCGGWRGGGPSGSKLVRAECSRGQGRALDVGISIGGELNTHCRLSVSRGASRPLWRRVPRAASASPMHGVESRALELVRPELI